ncbi:MAG: DarT ssDNA thymidine ADP-ribosyltransferase family protein [Ignavibacteriaceae bacterium]
MKVKDLRVFRKFYKEDVRKIKDPSRNEHFIGHSYQNGLEQVFGFFELFHADKRDIDKFITPFLDMAQDWQAIYEFLQNAFDAKSKTFALVFDEDYLIAFNDGEQFSFEGIRSILNIGQSTKESKSNIGKFGVGFKIVHRLIGESNGKGELKKLNGPILFSWKTNSDLQSFLNYDSTQNIIHCEPKIIHVDGGYTCEDDYPWLIKILVTNFPCGVNDEIYDFNYNKISNTLSIEELTKFIKFAKEKLFKNHLSDLSKFNRGTITFLKLGKNKNERLEENHVRKGISYSLSILNNLGEKYTSHKLEKVYLNDLANPFQPADISIYEFIIAQNDTSYKDITSDLTDEEKPEFVEFYLGVSNSSDDTSIKSNPNFYLYFPISDELHKYNFIIHCNIFHNLSQRTSLDDGARNKKLLKCLSDKIISKLEFLKTKDFKEYTKIYSAILSSEWSSLPNKLWVYEYLMKPLSDYAKKNVPTISDRAILKENVRIKDTALGINPSHFAVKQFDWFYSDEEVLISAAKTPAKLNLKPASLTDLIISSSDVKIINEWIGNNKDTIGQILVELNKAHIKRDETVPSGGQLIRQTNLLTKRLNELKLFSFADGEFYSVNEIKSSAERILITEDFNSILEVLKKLGFKYYQLDSSKLINVYDFLAGEFGYLKDKNKFLDYLSIKLDSSKNALSLDDIQILISFFNAISAPMFNKLLFTKEQNGYRVEKRGENVHQYFIAPKHQKLKNFISENLKDYLVQLPDELYLVVENKSGLLEEVALYKKIMSLIKDFPPFIDAIAEADSKEVQREYLDKFKYVELLEGTVYNKETFEHKILTLARSIDYDIIREKVRIRTINGALISLESISFHNKVVFKKIESDDSEKYELILSKILPNYSQSSELIEKVLKSFIDFNHNNLGQFLGLGRGKPKSEIINELSSNIENAHQLAFLLLYLTENSKKDIDFTKYKIQDRQGVFNNLQKGKYYTEDLKYIHKEKLLNQKYTEVKDLLRLSSENPQFEIEGTSIVVEPFFKDGVFFCFPLKNELKDDLEAQQEIFMAMYKKYSSLNDRPEKIEIDGTVWNQNSAAELKYTNENKNLILGFNPEKSVYPDFYATDEEKLPDWIKAGIEKSETSLKLQFLSAIGVNMESSELIQLRKALLGKVETDEQTIVNLAKLQRGYLSRTMEWLTSRKIIISENMPQLKYVRKIVDIIPFSYSTPAPIICSITEDHTFRYSIIRFNADTKVWCIDSDLKEELKNYGENILSKIFSTIDGSLIDLDLFPTQEDEKLSLKRIEIHLELNKEKLLNECTELFNEYYKLWKQELKGLFKIYKTPFGSSNLSYNIYFNNILIDSIDIVKKIDIDAEGNIFFTGNENELIQVLEEIIDRNGFLKEHLDSLSQKRQDTPEEIKKLFEGEFEPPPQDELDALIPARETFFPQGEDKSFKEKLLELLSLSDSPYSGYAFHFTHIENAVSIIQSGKIQSRNLSRFRDSAGASFISTTDTLIKNFARFYFRPKTPTQYYNEGLGKETKNNDLPQCPVPIFFKVKIEEVLDKFGENCFVSNGNLRWYPKTQIGNDYDFLRSFDFINLYKSYAECGRWAFLSASQQEFVVKDELDLSRLTSVEIICRSKNDKDTLQNLIGIDNPYYSQITADPSYYYNENAIVKITQGEAKINASFSYRRPFESLKILSIKNVNSTPVKDVTKASDHISVVSSSSGIYSAYYINGKTNQEWLLFTNGLIPEQTVEDETPDENEKLISSVIEVDERLKNIFSALVRHYKLFDHIKNVLNEFDKYFKDWKFEEVLSREKMKVFLVIHDIGKPQAIDSLDKNLQHKFSLQLFEDIKDKLELSAIETKIFRALLSDDPLGKYFQYKLFKDKTLELINSIAVRYDINVKEYFELLTVYYQVDAGSYTKDAGGLVYLENLFKYAYGEKVLEKSGKRLVFSTIYESRYIELFNEIAI